MKHQRVIVVTGASAGLGRAIVHEFARPGVKIGLIARDEDGLRAAAREVQDLGGTALVLPLDVADADAVEAAATQVEETLGPIDVWVNNAMVSVFSPVKEMNAAEFKRVTDVTYLGYVHGTLSALKRMLSRNEGVIVQVGSALAYRAIPLQSAYCAAKHAIKGFTESLRCELLHDRSKVKVTMVHMPALNTPQFSWVKSRLPNKPQPVPPIYQPEVGARAVVWAAEHAPRELKVGYPTLEAVLGEKLFPGYLDRYLSKTGYAAQQTDEPVATDRLDNLYQAVAGDHGAHGDFDSRATYKSEQLWLATHKPLLAVAMGSVLSLAYYLKTKAQRKNRRAS
ncbi:MAG TPA: SDR family oxidoreductase [Planktothrix sp.]|jgi:NAD(P)-dependent dehydrogenase (short-subunit alcohol dehydrogenase family)